MSEEIEIEVNNTFMNNAIEAIEILTIPQLIQVLNVVAGSYKQAHADLQTTWFNINTNEPDEDAGKAWKIAAEGLKKTADDVEKYWETL